MNDWCNKCRFTEYDGGQEPCINCFVKYNENPSEYKPRSNGDKLRNMNNIQLAIFLGRIAGCPLLVMGKCPKDRTPSVGCCSSADCWFIFLSEQVMEESNNEPENQ